MDDVRFDCLAAALGASPSRRRLLGTLLGTVLADPLAAPKRASGKKKKKRQECTRAQPVRCGNKCCKPFETCKQGRCVHHCRDGVKNFGETGIDCGGSCVEDPRSLFGTCALGQGCKADADCFTQVCEATSGPGKICVRCRIDRDCDQFGPPSFRCVDNECFHCVLSTDCPRPGQPAENRFCIEPLAGDCPNNQPCVCGECRQRDDCPPDQFCDENGSCVECLSDTDCANRPGRPVCVDDVCKECARDADCPTPGQVCVSNACITPATCPAGGDICAQGFLVSLACGRSSGCRCHTMAEGETRCVSPLEFICRNQPACTSRAQCEARHGPGAFCVKDTGNFCGCSHCAVQCA